MLFTLPELSFARDALSPWISSETIEFHHGKHHAGYIKKLNAAIEGMGGTEESLEEIIYSSREKNSALFNSAAQHFNHSFFWECLTAVSESPGQDLCEVLDRDFGSVEAFKEKFSTVAKSLFGSGWVWLVKDNEGALTIQQTKDAETPIGTGKIPLLTLDVWEHAYYIDYRNNRSAFVEGFWGKVHWKNVEKRRVA